jgi:hypothetical protein
LLTAPALGISGASADFTSRGAALLNCEFIMLWCIAHKDMYSCNNSVSNSSYISRNKTSNQSGIVHHVPIINLVCFESLHQR